MREVQTLPFCQYARLEAYVLSKSLQEEHGKMKEEGLSVIAGAPDKPMVINGVEIPCYVLEDEARVLSQRGLLSGLGISGRGIITLEGGTQVPRFAASQALAPHITGETMMALSNPILFTLDGASTAYGYPASLLPDLCDAYLAARAAGDLRPGQKHIADRCEILIRGLARVGIIALVDEATGYQVVRANRALAEVIEKFIDKNLQPWTKTFPDEYFAEIYRLNGWGQFNRSANCPSVVGCYTNNIVYDRLAPGVLAELQKKNPIAGNGHRRFRHHQYLTPGHGYPKLREHLVVVIALMRAQNQWDDFMDSLTRVYPKFGDQIAMAMGHYGD